MDGERGRSLGQKIFLTIIVIIGLALLWFGSCFAIGSIAFGMSFSSSGASGVLGTIIFFLAFAIPTVLVSFLFVKFIRGLNKKSPPGSQQTLQ